MTTATKTFQEEQLIAYLQDVKDSYTFTIFYPNAEGKLEHFKDVSKVYSRFNDFAYVYDHTYHGVDASSSLDFNHDSKVAAIYFPTANTLVFNSSYRLKELANSCQTLKVTHQDAVENELLEALEAEMDNMESVIRSEFMPTELEIASFMETYERYIANEIITGTLDKSLNRFIDPSWYSYVNIMSNYYDYLMDGTSFLRRKIERYKKQGKSYISSTVKYRIARERLKPVLEQDPDVIKATKIHALFTNELESAMNVWVVKHDGEKVKVEKKVSCWDKPHLLIGRNTYNPHVHMRDVKAIKHGHKTFEF